MPPEHITPDCKVPNKWIELEEGETKILIPSRDGRFRRFQNYQNQLLAPFVIYVHFEALKVPDDSSLVHKPYNFGYYTKCSYDDSLSKYSSYRGEDCIEKFWQMIEETCLEISEAMNQKPNKSPLKVVELSKYYEATNCCFCQQEVSMNNRVKDFFPMTGRFLGTTHELCRSEYHLSNNVPVVVENFSKIWSLFLVAGLKIDEELEVIGKSKESIISFTKRVGLIQLRFLDTNKFWKSNIEGINKELKNDQKIITKSAFCGKQAQLVTKLISFPFNYANSYQKLSNRKFPNKAGFYNATREANISEEDFQFSKRIWQVFQCDSLGEFSDIYVKQRVLLLADIFEGFRRVCVKNYGLDLAHYFTTAQLSWDAMLKFTKVNIELMTDFEMIEFIKNNMRGGYSHASQRFSKANNKYVKDFDATKSTTFIVSLDANNLAGWAMTQPLPVGQFSWLSNSEMETLLLTLSEIAEDAEFGYILECDLDYPEKLHDLHNDLPFCCQHVVNNTKKRLMTNLGNKRNYVTHYRNLQQFLKNGLVLVKIHRVLKFKQSDWLKGYVEFNTELRTAAESDFERNFFKLMNNCIKGKSCQNVDKKVQLTIVTNKHRSAEILANNPKANRLQLTENVSVFQTETRQKKYNKSIYAGFSIFELSKIFIYGFHYDRMLAIYPKGLKLLYTDTDSLIYEIPTENFFADLAENPKFLNIFDTSDVDEKWKLPKINKKVLGKMKIEYGGKVIRDFYGTGPKAFCLDVEGELVKRAVGVLQSLSETVLSKESYKSCVFDNEKIIGNRVETRLRDGQIVTKSETRIFLRPGDWKREIMDDKISTLAQNHYKLKRL